MAFLGTLGLSQGYYLTRPRFDSKGMVFKPIFYSSILDPVPLKKFIFVDLVVGADVVQFVPYSADDVLGRFSNPFHILYGAITNVRRRNQWLAAISAWSNIFPENPGSGFSCVNMFGRTVIPAIIYRDDDNVYDVPRGLQGNRVLLGLSPTAINGLLEQVRQLGPVARDPAGPVFYLEPRKAKSVGNTVTMSSYAVTAVENPNPNLSQSIAQLSEEEFSFDDVLRPLNLDEQVELLCYSGVPKSAVVYALHGHALLSNLPENYVEAGNEELRALQQGNSGGFPGQAPQQYPAVGNPLPATQFHPEQFKQAAYQPPYQPQAYQQPVQASQSPVPAPRPNDGAGNGHPGIQQGYNYPAYNPAPFTPPPQAPQPPAQMQQRDGNLQGVPPAHQPIPSPGSASVSPGGSVPPLPASSAGNDIPELPKSISDLVNRVRNSLG